MNDLKSKKFIDYMKFVLWDIILYGVIIGLGAVALSRYAANDSGVTLLRMIVVIIMMYLAIILLAIFSDILLHSVIITKGGIRTAFKPSERRLGLYSHVVEISKDRFVRVRMAKSSYKYTDKKLIIHYGKLSKQVLFIEQLPPGDSL